MYSITLYRTYLNFLPIFVKTHVLNAHNVLTNVANRSKASTLLILTNGVQLCSHGVNIISVCFWSTIVFKLVFVMYIRI
jgi:hypothetical protein